METKLERHNLTLVGQEFGILFVSMKKGRPSEVKQVISML